MLCLLHRSLLYDGKTGDAFQKTARDQRADAFALIEALDYLSAQDVRIVNLSLAGPPNTALARQIADMAAADMLLIAAAAAFIGAQKGGKARDEGRIWGGLTHRPLRPR